MEADEAAMDVVQPQGGHAQRRATVRADRAARQKRDQQSTKRDAQEAQDDDSDDDDTGYIALLQLFLLAEDFLNMYCS